MMHLHLCPTAESLGYHAALETAEIIREAIAKDGCARIILSTGASQFTTLAALVEMPDIDWSKVEMFHLDEYGTLPEDHPASFRKYLKERFVSKTNCGTVHFVDGTEECIATLTKELDRAPIHVGLIGIGQNTHIAFNDPPANTETKDAYLIVNLDDVCRGQQVQEGWFKSIDDVPKFALSMSVDRIMRCQKIISAVPYACKASAIKRTLESKVTNMVPATIMKTHPCFSVYMDHDSFAQADLNKLVLPEGMDSCEMTVYTK